jgi:sphingomyelin phosphodiesterase acid-like 3
MEAAGHVMSNLSAMLKEYFPETEIIVSLGNNDVVPDYFLELKEESTELGNSSLSVKDAGMLGVLFSALSYDETETQKSGRGLLTQSDEWTFLRGGYYSRTLHNGNLMVLSLNTVLYASYFEPESTNVDDPGKQFLWMKKMLDYSRERQCQVIIMGHVPPTLGSYRHNQFWKHEYVTRYYSLVEEYDDLVIAQLFGHLHSDEFRVGDKNLASMNTETKTQVIPFLSSPLLLGPSVTPLHGNYPAFRLVKYGRVGEGNNRQYAKGQFKLLDYESFRSLIDIGGNWTKLYTFSEVYSSDYVREDGLSSLTMNSIVESMEDTVQGKESRILKTFRSLVLSGATGESQHAGLDMECSEECRDEWLCTFRSATSDGYENCLLMRRESREKAKGVMFVTLAAVFGTVSALLIMIRWRKACRRRHYEKTPSVTGDVGPSIEATERL